MPLVSVVMPAYNQGAFIGEAIRSVLKQTFEDFDLHVIDDGSTDDTPEVVKSFDDERLRYFRQENSGLSAARNAGIARSRGEFIAFLDSDDLWLPDKLARQVRAMRANPNCGIVACNFRCVGDHSFVDKAFLRSNVPTGKVFEKLLHTGFILPSMAMARRAALEKVGLFDTDLRRCEDYDMWLRITHDFEFEYVEQVGGLYRIHAASMTKGADPFEWLVPAIRVVEKICETHRLPRKLADSALAVHYARLAFHCMRAGDAKAFREAARRSAGRRMTVPLAGILLGRALLGAKGLVRLFDFLRSRGFGLPHTYRR